MWWRWRGAPAALGLGLALCPASGRAVELTRLDARASPHGAVVRLQLSGAVTPTVRSVDGGARLYVDFPRGTRLAATAVGGVRPVPPVGRLRAGVTGDGTPRVVVELIAPAVPHVRRQGRVVAVELVAAASPVDDRAPEPAATILARPAPPTRLAGPRPKIVLDPGHGGRDPGAQGFGVEKDVTLAIARGLAERLRDRLDADVILTRDGDETLPLADRTERANREGADLFLSIHANASTGGRLHGVETYYLNNTDDRATMRLASMENGLGGVAGPRPGADLRYILSDLVQVGKMEDSIALARAVQRGLVAELRTRHPITDLGVKQGPFYVLVGAYMPCVLVETSFLTHPVEGRRLAGPAYQAAVAAGLYRGVARFLADARRAQTL